MGSWWRTMRIRQTKLPPFAVRCVSCQEPHRFSQNLESQSQPRRFCYAQLGEPLYHRGTTDPPTTRLRRTSYTDVTDGTFELRSFLGHSAFACPPKPCAKAGHFPDNSHRKFPPNNFPGRSGSCRTARLQTTPSWMAMGIGPPQTIIKPNK